MNLPQHGLPRRARRLCALALAGAVLVACLWTADRFVDRFMLSPRHTVNFWPGIHHPRLMPPHYLSVIRDPNTGRFVVATNSLGMRDEDYAPSFYRRRPGPLRVLLLGDSFTFGYGVDADKTYHSLVESRLRGVAFFNGAFNGCNLTEERDLLYYFLDKVHPNLVLVAIAPNSLTDIRLPWRPHWLERVGIPLELVVWLQGKVPFLADDSSAVYRVVLRRRTRRLFDEFARLLRGMEGSLGRRRPGIPLALVLLPHQEQVLPSFKLPKGFSWLAPFGHIKRSLEGSTILILDSSERFLAHPDRESLFFPRDRHFTERGHRLLADFLVEKMPELRALLRREGRPMASVPSGVRGP